MSLRDLNSELEEELKPRNNNQGNAFAGALRRLRSNSIGALTERNKYPDEKRLEDILLQLE